MRLIDADKLIERIEEIARTDMMQVLVEDWVNSQPTAFDVDKVVEQLEVVSNSSKTEPTDLGFVDEYKWVFLNDAIRIVKAGESIGNI